MSERVKRAAQLFEESRTEFDGAHADGMRSLRDGDLSGLEVAINQERAAIEKARTAIGAIDVQDNESPRTPHYSHALEDPTESADEEFLRLSGQMEVLEREHRTLQGRPDDLDGHRAHRERLQQQISELRAHIVRIRQHPRLP